MAKAGSSTDGTTTGVLGRGMSDCWLYLECRPLPQPPLPQPQIDGGLGGEGESDRLGVGAAGDFPEINSEDE